MAKQPFSYSDYIASLPAERKAAVEEVWKAVRESMPAGYTEEFSPKYLTFAAGGEMYVALANQKNYITLHLIPIYVFPELKAKLDNSDKKPKVGKGCVNFLSAEELPLDIIGQIIGSCEAETYKEKMQQIRGKGKSKKQPSA
jgi:5,10-methenyltetrahydromethanopterin hydrogenase